MAETTNRRGTYRTRQQAQILQYLQKFNHTFITAEALMEAMHRDGISIGQTTVYRALCRLEENGCVVKIASPDLGRGQYRYIDCQDTSPHGKLLCLKCGRAFPLECSQLDSFSQHISREHQFSIDHQKTVLFGYCRPCQMEEDQTTGEDALNSQTCRRSCSAQTPPSDCAPGKDPRDE